MSKGERTTKRETRPLNLSVPLLLLVAFGLGAGTTWLIMRESSNPPPKPAIESFLPPSAAQPTAVAQAPASIPAEPPDVSQLTPAEAERTLANWNYDRQNWSHAIQHYNQAIAFGDDTPDVRTDFGNCYRFLNQPEKALEQYQIAQKQNPQHENSLFNQISLYAEALHDPNRAAATGRDFLARFPQSAKADTVRKELQAMDQDSRGGR